MGGGGLGVVFYMYSVLMFHGFIGFFLFIGLLSPYG